MGVKSKESALQQYHPARHRRFSRVHERFASHCKRANSLHHRPEHPRQFVCCGEWQLQILGYSLLLKIKAHTLQMSLGIFQ